MRGRRDVAAFMATIASLLVVAATLTWPGAGADTIGTPDPVSKAKVGTGITPVPTILPPGPLTGLSDGTTVHIHTDAGAGAHNAVFRVTARICKKDLNITQPAEFAPTTFGNCLPPSQAFGTNSDTNVLVDSAPPNTSLDLEFRVGTGSKTFTFSGGQTSTITCNDANPCALWLDHSVDTAATSDGSGHIFKHFDLFYGASVPSSTTSTSLSTSTTLSTSSSTTVGSSSTSSSSTTPGSTSTTSLESSTTTTAVSTGVTVSPSTVEAGGSVQVTSSDWMANSEVTAVLHSDPVTLGKLTADATGAIAGSLTIPAATAAGAHTLELTGTGAAGESRTVSTAVTVVDPSTSGSGGATPGSGSGSSSGGGSVLGELARTGFMALRLLALAAALFGAGALLVAGARNQLRRR